MRLVLTFDNNKIQYKLQLQCSKSYGYKNIYQYQQNQPGDLVLISNKDTSNWLLARGSEIYQNHGNLIQIVKLKKIALTDSQQSCVFSKHIIEIKMCDQK